MIGGPCGSHGLEHISLRQAPCGAQYVIYMDDIHNMTTPHKTAARSPRLIAGDTVGVLSRLDTGRLLGPPTTRGIDPETRTGWRTRITVRSASTGRGCPPGVPVPHPALPALPVPPSRAQLPRCAHTPHPRAPPSNDCRHPTPQAPQPNPV